MINGLQFLLNFAFKFNLRRYTECDDALLDYLNEDGQVGPGVGPHPFTFLA